MTDRTKHHFEVKTHFDDDENAHPRIVLTLVKSPDLPVLKRGFLGLDLQPGTTIEEAEQLAEMLNDMVVSTSYTDPHAKAERMREEQEELANRKRDGRLM